MPFYSKLEISHINDTLCSRKRTVHVIMNNSLGLKVFWDVIIALSCKQTNSGKISGKIVDLIPKIADDKNLKSRLLKGFEIPTTDDCQQVEFLF